jgi:hypothetical protein
MFLRKTYGSRLNIFAPVNDLSLLSRSGAEDKSLVAGQKNDVEITGGQLLGDEYSDHVVKVSFFRATCTTRTHHLPQNRSGIILRETYVIQRARVMCLPCVYESARFSSQTCGCQNLIVFPILSAGRSTLGTFLELTSMPAVNQLNLQLMRWWIVSRTPTRMRTRLYG